MVDWVWLAARLPPGVDDRRGPCSQAATALAALALAATPASVLHRFTCFGGAAGVVHEMNFLKLYSVFSGLVPTF